MANKSNVADILKQPFSNRNFETTLNMVSDSKPRPSLDNLLCKHKDKKANYTKHISISLYERTEYLKGCE